MSKRTDVRPGDQFGRWTVLYETDQRIVPSGQGLRIVACRCECGTVRGRLLQTLVAGRTRSCGCLNQERRTKHGLHGHPLYLTWYGMMDRCHNDRGKNFENYGARGIRVHPAWHGIPDGLRSYINWVEVNLGSRPEGTYPSGVPLYSIDRVNNDGHYEPGNLRWATVSQQQRNKRPFSRPQQRRAQ